MRPTGEGAFQKTVCKAPVGRGVPAEPFSLIPEAASMSARRRRLERFKTVFEEPDFAASVYKWIGFSRGERLVERPSWSFGEVLRGTGWKPVLPTRNDYNIS